MAEPSVKKFDSLVDALGGVRAAGARFGCSPATVSNLRHRRRKPGRGLAARIERVSKRRGTPVLATGWGA